MNTHTVIQELRYHVFDGTDESAAQILKDFNLRGEVIRIGGIVPALVFITMNTFSRIQRSDGKETSGDWRILEKDHVIFYKPVMGEFKILDILPKQLFDVWFKKPGEEPTH